jgi:plasmid stability protein
MPSLTLKNVPDALLTRLRTQAAARRRSVNSEAIAVLEVGVQATVVDPEALLSWVRNVRITPRRPVSDRRLSRARQAGRL